MNKPTVATSLPIALSQKQQLSASLEHKNNEALGAVFNMRNCSGIKTHRQFHCTMLKDYLECHKYRELQRSGEVSELLAPSGKRPRVGSMRAEPIRAGVSGNDPRFRASTGLANEKNQQNKQNRARFKGRSCWSCLALNWRVKTVTAPVTAKQQEQHLE